MSSVIAGQVAGGGGILSYLLLVCISSIIELNKKTSCKGK